MPLLSRKHTIYGRIEAREGEAIALTSDHGHLALAPTSRPTKEMIPRDAASASLSPETDNIATGPTTFEFGIDCRGSGSTSSLPVWDPLIRACGMRQVVGGQLVKLTIGAITGGNLEFLPGQTIVGGTSGGSGKVVSITPNGVTELFVLQIEGEQGFDVAEVVSVSGGSSATTSVVGTGGVYYTPDSVVASTIATSGAWSGAATLGEVLVGGTSGARARLIAGNSGTPGTIYVEMIVGMGSFSAGETLTGQESGRTIAVHGTPAETLIWTPSLTMRSNIDGLFREAVGTRGNFSWSLSAKQPSRFQFSFMGDTSTIDDGQPPTGTTHPTTKVLQFANSVAIINGTYRAPIGAIEFDLGNAVNERADPNSVSGCRSYVITGRNPTVRLDPEAVLTGAFNWYQKWQDAETVSLWASLGRIAGNRLTLFIPKLQVQDIEDGNRNDLWTFPITGKAARNTDAGGDEVFIFVT